MSDADVPDSPEEFELDEEPGDEDGEPVAAVPLAENENDPIPALREVRARLVTLGDDKKISSEGGETGETVVLLEDPEGLAGKSAALSTWAYAMAMLFDGHRSALEVVVAFNEKYGQTIEAVQALELQRELDKATFLLSKRFEKVLQKHVRGYLDKEVRPAAHAGSAYPEEPEALRETIAGFFSLEDGPGALSAEASAAPGAAARPPIRALLLPHIDLRVGGATYAHGYRALLEQSQADLFIILGVAHQSSAHATYYVSQKDFATPLGVLKNSRALARKLQTAADAEPALAELSHRTEHSIEFQAVLLMNLLTERCKRDIQIVPVLCGSVDADMLSEDGGATLTERLRARPGTRKFIDKLRAELDASKRNWCILCSVDLSHVGPEFGHSTMITERLLPPIRRGDMRLLHCAERLDLDGFMAEVERTQNSRHVDAVMSVFTLLEACKGLLKGGRVLHYDQMLKSGTHSAVSYASMAFE